MIQFLTEDHHPIEPAPLLSLSPVQSFAMSKALRSALDYYDVC
jgi:hypothetical protein